MMRVDSFVVDCHGSPSPGRRTRSRAPGPGPGEHEPTAHQAPALVVVLRQKHAGIPLEGLGHRTARPTRSNKPRRGRHIERNAPSAEAHHWSRVGSSTTPPALGNSEAGSTYRAPREVAGWGAGQYVRRMGAPVWGTFSVRDHCLREAYLREVLLFDRLAIPYPDPLIEGERERWRRPNPADASETWDPERLDVLLGILGTQESAGYNGARLAKLVRWGPQTWQELQSRLDTAHALTGNHFVDTSKGLHLVPGSEIPGIVEAVAAYPTQAQWRQEVRPTMEEPHTVSAAEALVAVPRPLLLPEPGGDELDVLRRAVDLAMDEEYAAMRAAYFDWFRDRVARLRTLRTSR